MAVFVRPVKPVGPFTIDKQTQNQHSAKPFKLCLGVVSLANNPQAKKRARQSEKQRQHNVALRSTVRTTIKKVVNAVASGDKSQAEIAYQAAVPTIDVMARKRLISKNKAARHKSRLSTRIRALQ